MARPRTRENQNLPTGLRTHKRTRKNGKTVIYYSYRTADGKEKSLGTDYHYACVEAAKLNLERSLPKEIINFNDLALRYEVEVIAVRKVTNTINANKYNLKNLRKFFGGDNPAPLDKIEPHHIKQYLEWRKATPSAANNEIKLFHHMWTKAREWGYTRYSCPSEGIERFKETPRDVYIEDFLLEKLYEFADQDLKDMMDIAYLTGQRPIDVIGIHKKHIYNDVLHFTQQKTKAKLRFAIIGRLKAILDRRLIDLPPHGYLFSNKAGNKLQRHSLTTQFKSVRDKAIAHYPELADELAIIQFRDLRAKSGTDKYLAEGTESAKAQLGHASEQMTKRYIRKTKILLPNQ